MEAVGLSVVLIIAIIIGFRIMKEVGAFLEINRKWVEEVPQDGEEPTQIANHGESADGNKKSKA